MQMAGKEPIANFPKGGVGGVVVVERGPIVVGFGKKSGTEVRSSKGTRGVLLEGEMEAGEAKMERGADERYIYGGTVYRRGRSPYT
jgi:hypothetical protein